MGKKKVAMDIINPHSAGIDIGSRSHFVAVGQDESFGIWWSNKYPTTHQQITSF